MPAVLWLVRRSYVAYVIVKTARALSVIVIIPALLAAVVLLYLGLAIKESILAIVVTPTVVSEFVNDGNYFRGFSRAYYRELWHQKENQP